MATVTGLTAERMIAIEASSVVDGEVVGDNLILTRFDESEIDAGNVRGPQGYGVASTTVHYQVSTSGTTIPTGTWATSIPSVPANQFLWTRVVINFTNSTNTTFYSVSKAGQTGNTGPANTLAIGTVTTGAPGSAAAATITGTAPSQTLNLTLPRGTAGPNNVLSVGTVQTGAPGSNVVVTITGTSPSQVLNITIPRGDKGDPGDVTIAQVRAAISGTVTNLGNRTGTVNLGSLVTAEAAVNGVVTMTLTGNVTITAAQMPVVAAGTQFAMVLTQGSTPRTLTLTNILKSEGALDISTVANAKDVIVFFYDGTSWYATMSGKGFAA